MEPFRIIKKFLQSHIQGDRPLLLGYSGGIDSSALLHLLIECQKDMGFALHIVHVDHGWRSTSSEEASWIGSYSQTYGIHCHIEKIQGIDPAINDSNLEERYRDARFVIFKKIYQDIGAQALVIAHQQEDQIETVFKRVFEGASFRKIAGLQEVSSLYDMIVWRPLLQVSKKKLIQLVQKKNWPWIFDPTNQDTHYLRARQRLLLFPEIEKSFGKGCLHHLCRLAEHARRFEEYMDHQIQRYWDNTLLDAYGGRLNIKALYPLQRLEFEHYIRKLSDRVAQQYGYSAYLSYAALETLWSKVSQLESNKKVISKDYEWVVNKGCLFLKKLMPMEYRQDPQPIEGTCLEPAGVNFIEEEKI